MCDFHSVIITGDGRIWHQPENSHSGIASHYDLTNTPGTQEFWEVEHNGEGALPIPLVRQRYGDYGKPIPSLVERVASQHYEKLRAVMAGEIRWEDTAPFNTPEYADVPQRIQYVADRKARLAEQEAARLEAKRIADEKAELLAAHVEPLAALIENIDNCDQTEVVLGILAELGIEVDRDFLESAEVDIDDIARDEIEAAEESGQESGYQSALESDDYYSSDAYSEGCSEAKQEGRDEMESEMEEKIKEAYAKGFAACKAGSQPPAEFINGLPVFLF